MIYACSAYIWSKGWFALQYKKMMMMMMMIIPFGQLDDYYYDKSVWAHGLWVRDVST
jgi:hypothetical protein